MKMLPSRNELNVLKRSLVLMFGLTIALWIPLKIVVSLQNLEAAKFKMSGGTINTSKLERYEKANERIVYFSTGIAFLLSQSAMWLVAISKKEDEVVEQPHDP